MKRDEDRIQSFSLKDNFLYWYYDIAKKTQERIGKNLEKNKKPWEHDIELVDIKFRNISLNFETMRNGEIPSANIMASAKGLAKLGAFMANGG